LFAKVGYFSIVQTFLVAAISSTLLSSLSDIVDDPLSLPALFAEALPSQAVTFMIFILVQTGLNKTLEVRSP
jgi:hypothetical protein